MRNQIQVNSKESAQAVRYRFGSDGLVVTLTRSSPDSDEWVERAGAPIHSFKLDDPTTPSHIDFFEVGSATPRGSQDITKYDDGSFTTLDINSEPRRWIRVDPDRYFIQLKAVRGEVHQGGLAFATMIRTGQNGRADIQAFGLYMADDLAIVGAIPTALVSKHLVESRLDSEAMLRVELTHSEYERAMAVFRSWERRAREKKLLYAQPYLNSIVFMEQMARTLNQCNERVKVKRLKWIPNDPITTHNHPQIPFYYLRDLRKDNESVHMSNEQFRDRMGSSCVGACRAPLVTQPAQSATKLSMHRN